MIVTLIISKTIERDDAAKENGNDTINNNIKKRSTTNDKI